MLTWLDRGPETLYSLQQISGMPHPVGVPVHSRLLPRFITGFSNSLETLNQLVPSA